MTLPRGLMVYPRYTLPINVISPVAPSKSIIHQVMAKRPSPHIRPSDTANALTFNFMFLISLSRGYGALAENLSTFGFTSLA